MIKTRVLPSKRCVIDTPVGPVSGVNPASPEKRDGVICWGDQCEGSWGASMRARAKHVRAEDCACYRKKMGWNH